jgi:hypothetical protein
MATRNMEVSANSEIELLTKLAAFQEILKLPTDQLKRLSQLAKSEKAKSYLSSEIKFAGLKAFL